VVMMARRLNHRELTGPPGRGITHHGKIVQEQLGVAALAADAGPERKLAPAPQGDLTGSDCPRFDLWRPD
jgi:hypothetical protein